MTTEQPIHPFHNGPYLICAVLCERVLREVDGVKTAVRMVDRVTHTVSHPNAPDEMQPFTYELSLLIRFKAGVARGRFSLTLRIEKPNGESHPTPGFNLFFDSSDDRGVDVVVPLRMIIGLQGLYWIDVLLDGTRVTRVPLRVLYNPIRPLVASGGLNPGLPPGE